MDEEYLLKMIGFIVFSMFAIYYVSKCLHLQTSIIEGLEAATPAATPAPPGAASGAKAYAESIKALTVKMKDELLIETYRTDYENLIIALDDFCDVITLKCLLNVKVGEPNAEFQMMMAMQQLNLYKAARTSLNDVMTFIDKQSGTASATAATTSLTASTSSLF